EKPSAAEAAAGFRKLAKIRLRNAAGSRGLSSHVRVLSRDITTLRQLGAKWRWIASVLAEVRGEDLDDKFVSAVRAAYHAIDQNGPALAIADGDRFKAELLASVETPFGRTSLSGQMPLLRSHSEALLNDGVGRDRITSQVAAAPGTEPMRRNLSEQLRSLYSRLRKEEAG